MSHRSAVFQDGGIGQPLDYRIAAHANALDKELDYKRSQVKPEKIDTGYLDDLKVGESGLNPVDKITKGEIPSTIQWAAQQLGKHKDPLWVKLQVQDRMGKAATAVTVAKNGKAEVDDVSKQMDGKYSPEEIARFKNLAYGKISSMMVGKDAEGNEVINDLSHIPLNKSFTSDLFEPQNMGQWANLDGKALTEYFKTVPKVPLKKENEVNKKGFVDKVGYTGFENKLAKKIYDDNGEIIGQETIYEEVPVGNMGQKVRVLPQNIEDEILSDPQRKAELNKLAAMDLARYEAQTGNQMSDEDAHKYMRGFLYQYADANKTHEFHPNEKTVIPKPASINVNTGSKAPKEVTIRDIYGDVKTVIDNLKKQGLGSSASMAHLPSTARTVLLKFAKESDDAVTMDDLYLVEDNTGTINLYKHGTGEGKRNILIGPIDKVGTNVPAQPTAPGKQKVIKQGATKITNKFKGVPPKGF